MKYCYYPGCTLKTKAKELDLCGRRAAEALGITLCELPEWQCCGGAYTTASDEIATKLASLRALAAAEKEGGVLVTLCTACHHVLKQVEREYRTNPDFAGKAKAYLAPEIPYGGTVRVVHYLELLRDTVGFENLAKKVVKPLVGRKIGAYYGCLFLRPGKVMETDDPENPRLLEDFIAALGGEAVLYPYRNECCGGYTVLENPPAAEKRSREILESAAGFGADCLVTACPLCKYNLEKTGEGKPRVLYFTELLAEALGVREEKA